MAGSEWTRELKLLEDTNQIGEHLVLRSHVTEPWVSRRPCHDVTPERREFVGRFEKNGHRGSPSCYALAPDKQRGIGDARGSGELEASLVQVQVTLADMVRG